MKRLLLILCLFIGVKVQAQNYLGSAYKDVLTDMKEQGLKLTSQNFKDNDGFFLIAYDNSSVRIYFFTTLNSCYVYKYYTESSTPENLKVILLGLGYSYDGELYHSDQYTARIEYNTTLEYWGVVIKFRE